jgi:phosphoribosylaminoimidazole-succinocarboxamide synthase
MTMMLSNPAVPERVRSEDICPGLSMVSMGKVRNTFELPGHPDMLLAVVTDRASIFDQVLDFLVPSKGAALTIISHFWTTEVLGDLCANDLVAAGAAIDEFLPAELCGNSVLQARATVIRRLVMYPTEAVGRIYLTGSGWGSYQEDQTVCGHQLPAGLVNGSKLPMGAIFTPTTKATEGHDMPISADEVAAKYGPLMERMTIQLLTAASDFAATCGIIIADTKFEFGIDSCGQLVLGDEKLTPDSSRFWPKDKWAKAVRDGVAIPSLDKQPLRDAGEEHGKDQLATWQASESIIAQTTARYRYLVWLLTGKTIERYQRDVLGIAVDLPQVSVDLILGSQSDERYVQEAMDWLEGQGARVRFRKHVISAHRNPGVLDDYAKDGARGANRIVTVAGKLAALHGNLKVALERHGYPGIPVIGVGVPGSTEDACMAAKLSASQLPGTPVVLDRDGNGYYDSAGILAACKRAVDGDFLTETFESKPAVLEEEWR